MLGPLDPTIKKSNRPKFYMTKQRKKINIKEENHLQMIKFIATLRDCERGTFKSVRECVGHHQVLYLTIYRLFTDMNAVG